MKHKSVAACLWQLNIEVAGDAVVPEWTVLEEEDMINNGTAEDSKAAAAWKHHFTTWVSV